ncbi:BTAD domain-containing putative transcriptional regulator [Sporosarcina sp. CAU 1771]
MVQMPILQTKIISSVPTSTYMRRSSFIKKIKTSERVKLTLLHSGAGYGKSSGLASYFSDSRSMYSWYTVTAEDDDISPFITHLQLSIERITPNFGRSLDEWETPLMYPKGEDLNRWIALFINELCGIGEPITIIIDDFHLVDHVFHINYMMEKIIDYLPSHVHFVISTRNRPRWASLNKLKLTSQLCEIIEQDFIFTEEEIIVFFEDYFDTPLSSNEAEKIVEMTEGWAIAVNLMAMHMSDTEFTFTSVLKPALHELFSYLSEEVYKNMSEEDRMWLLSFSIFPVFSTQLVTEFYGAEAEKQLLELAEKHVFIQAFTEEGTYRFHSLFQQFLEEKWIETDVEQFIEYHKKATNFYTGNPSQALFHAIKSGDYWFIGKTAANFGAVLIKSGQFEWLLETLKELPQDVKERYYSLYYYEGEAHRYRAFYERARQSYLLCLNFSSIKEDPLFSSRANAGIAHIYLDTIQPGMAKPFLVEAIALGQSSSTMSVHEMEMLKRQFAENLVNLGKAKEATQWIDAEKMGTKILREGNLDARILLRTGKLNEAKTLLDEKMTDQYSLPDAHRETDVLIFLIYAMTGDVEEAMTSALKGIRLGVKEKSGFAEAVGWIRLGHAKILADPYDLIIPEQDYLQSIARMDELNVSRGKAEPLMGLSILKAMQGYYLEAVKYGEEGLRETEKVNDGWLSGLIQIGLSIVYFYSKEYTQSLHHSNSATLLFKECGDTYGEMVASYWMMSAYSKTTDTSLFMSKAVVVARLCNLYKYHFFLTKRTLFSPFDMQEIYPLFIRATNEEPDNNELKKIARYMNIEELNTHPGYTITVQLMGPFSISLGLDKLNERKWQRDKSKELFVFLLLHRNRYVSKEEIISELWRDTDGKTADRDFKVVLNALLKTIEPYRAPRETSFFIIRKQTMYRINPMALVTSDLDRFRAYVKTGLEEKNPKLASEKLLKAASLYKGLLFEERLDIEWLEKERESLEGLYIQMIERLAQTYTRLQEFRRTIYWAEKILRIDYTWEEAYRLLMFAHYQLGNRAGSVKWYNKCVQVLDAELLLKPMETTEQMYKIIMNES